MGLMRAGPSEPNADIFDDAKHVAWGFKSNEMILIMLINSKINSATMSKDPTQLCEGCSWVNGIRNAEYPDD